MTTEQATPEELWLDILEKDDRTSPEEYPDMALITFEEFRDNLKFFSDQHLAAANERIVRLEGALDTAARFHGIDIDVLCEQRVSAALEYPTSERSDTEEHPTADAIVDGITEIVADRFKTIGAENDLRFGAGVTVRDVVLLTVAMYIELINRLRAKAPP